MEQTLSPEMKDLIAALGALIKLDKRSTDFMEAIEDYEKSEELNGLIAEYNAQQNLLADLFSGSDAPDDDVRETVQNRIDALYDEITTHPVYAAYLETKQAFDALNSEVYAELQYAVTGKRPCSHDCSSCGGCH